jgi:hypothetical protein
MAGILPQMQKNEARRCGRSGRGVASDETGDLVIKAVWARRKKRDPSTAAGMTGK